MQFHSKANPSDFDRSLPCNLVVDHSSPTLKFTFVNKIYHRNIWIVSHYINRIRLLKAVKLWNFPNALKLYHSSYIVAVTFRILLFRRFSSLYITLLYITLHSRSTYPVNLLLLIVSHHFSSFSFFWPFSKRKWLCKAWNFLLNFIFGWKF